MPQGKFKVKNKAPVEPKKKTKTISKRKNCPVAPTKWKYIEGGRIKMAISKNVNRKAEEEIRLAVSDAPTVFIPKKKKQIKQLAGTKSSQPSASNKTQSS